MADTINRSPLWEVAQVSDGTLGAYNAFMQTRQNDFDTSIQGYNNNAPHPLTQTPLRAVLRNAYFVPASDDRYKTTRSGKVPAYVVIARVAPATASALTANLVAAVNEYARPSTTGVAVTPHVLFGVGGEVVQLVDFDHTALFLRGSYASPQGTTFSGVRDEVIDSIIRRVVLNEGGRAGFAGWNPNDGGFGISVGCIQFNQLKGGLLQLFQEMYRADSALFLEIFGPNSLKLLNADYVVNRATNLTYLELPFKKSATYPVFQRAQTKLAKEKYWTNADLWAKRLKLYSQRAYAILFDSTVQRWDQSFDYALRYLNDSMSEREKLNVIAQVADFEPYLTHKPGFKPYRRRRDLLNDPSLSDAPLNESTVVAPAKGPLTDENVIVFMLEGRTGDPVTRNQRDAVATALKVLNGQYRIPLAFNRMLGLDYLAGAVPAKSNPGPDFGYFDLLSAADQVPRSPAGTAFRPPQPLRKDDVTLAVLSLSNNLAATRKESNVKTYALLSAYEHVKEIDRALQFSSTRGNMAAAAARQARTQKQIDGQRAAGNEQVADSGVKPPPINPESVRGLLFDFSTGLWSDGKPVGKVDHGDV